MTTDRDALIRSLQEAAQVPGRNERLLEVAGVITEAVAPMPVVVVGGLALSYWTALEATDIDVLMPQTLEVSGRLEGLGLVRGAGERHWHLPDTQIAIEAPDSALAPEDSSVSAASPSGRPLEILSASDLLAWRLREFIGTGNPEVARHIVLLAGSAHLDQAQLEKSASAKEIAPALPLLAELTDTPDEGFSSLDFRAIAEGMRTACYHRSR